MATETAVAAAVAAFVALSEFSDDQTLIKMGKFNFIFEMKENRPNE